MQIDVIDNTEALKVICQQFSQSEFLALDTEFVRQRTYCPIFALLQLCDGNRIAIIDPVAINDLEPLMELLYNEQIIKVLHSARQDMEIFYYLNGKLPKPIYDSQVAAALSGDGEQISYAALVKHLLKVELDKSQTRTDWLKRPLTKKQLSYAADDVRFLAQLYPIQRQKLLRQDRLKWLDKDFQFLTKPSTYEPCPENMWRKIKGSNRLKNQQLAVLEKLTTWREKQAIRKNRPRRHIIGDDALLSMAINPPSDMEDLHNNTCIPEQFINTRGKTILELVQQGLQAPASEWPQQIRQYSLTHEEEALADCLMAILHISAHKNNISPRCLSNRKELEMLVKGTRELTILSGWRYELAGRQLLEFIEGRLLLTTADQKIQLSSVN